VLNNNIIVGFVALLLFVS